jgi:soluble lytic murein transglycosylase-like protein
MSISTTDKLSLLASLAPLRQAQENKNDRKDLGFSEKLEKALSAPPANTPGNEKAKAMAEALTLQMLQTSLSLSGDSQSGSTQPLPLNSQLPSANALLQAYRTTIPEAQENQPATAVPPASQNNHEVDTPRNLTQPHSRRDSSWLEPIIAKASRRYGVEVGLIKAVIKAESDFNPQAVSHAGARGLMQLMPATARSLGVSDSFDPEQNVMAGTRFLGDLLQRYNGNLDSALAAYNWGPGNVDRRPDRLPSETRNYLAKVKQLYSSYSA